MAQQYGLGGPINYYDMIPDFRREALQETQNQLGIAQLQQTRLQTSAAQQQLQQQRAFQAELPGAINDPSKLQALAVKYPTQVGAIKDQLQFKSAQDVAAVSSATGDLQTAAQIGPEAVAQALVKHASTVQSKGASPQQLMQLYVKDPQAFGNFLNTVKLGALGAKDQFDVQNDQTKNQLTMRGQDLSAETARRGQDITVRGQNISAANSSADRELQKLILQQRVISNQLDQAKTQTEIDGLKQKQTENQQKQADVQQQKQLSLGYASEAANIARTLADDPNLSQVTGSVSSRLPVWRDSSQDVLNQASRLQSLLTQDNLKMMSGVLTDRDIVFLGNISSGLNITDSGIKGSEESVRKRLKTIAEKLETKLSSQGYSAPNATASDQPSTATSTPPTQPSSGAGYSNLWGN